MGNPGNSALWRLTALTALVLLAASAVVAVWLVLRNPLLAIIFALTCCGLAAVAWRWFFGTGARAALPYLVAAAVLLVALVYEVVAFARETRNVWLVVGLLGLSALALAMGGLLRRRYAQMVGSYVIPVGERPFLIINPKSGSGRAIKAGIPDLARTKGIRVLMLEPGGSLTGLVETAVDGGATILGMSGGDGSLGVAAAAAMRHDIPMVALPGGTRCHFARDLGLEPERIADSLRSYGGREVRIDAGDINGRIFLNNASFGLYADIVGRPAYREKKLKSAVEALGSDEVAAGYPLRFRDGQHESRDRAVMVLVGVNRYETMNLMELGNRARLDEGILQITAIYHLEKTLIKQVAGVVKLDDSVASYPRDFAQWVVPDFSIAGEPAKIAAGVDGELVELDSPVRLRILPRGLRLMVPPEGLQPRRTASTAVARLRDFALSGRLPHE